MNYRAAAAAGAAGAAAVADDADNGAGPGAAIALGAESDALRADDVAVYLGVPVAVDSDAPILAGDARM